MKPKTSLRLKGINSGHCYVATHGFPRLPPMMVRDGTISRACHPRFLLSGTTMNTYGIWSLSEAFSVLARIPALCNYGLRLAGPFVMPERLGPKPPVIIELLAGKFDGRRSSQWRFKPNPLTRFWAPFYGPSFGRFTTFAARERRIDSFVAHANLALIKEV